MTTSVRRQHERKHAPLQVEMLELRELLCGTGSVSGEAFGVFVGVQTPGPPPVSVSVPKRPDVVLPSTGGTRSDQVANVTVGGIGSFASTLSSGTLTVKTVGTVGHNASNADSSAAVENVSILDGLVTADLIEAQCNSFADGISATSEGDGSVVQLTVAGIPITVAPPPNTSIAVPGGTVILNEQITGGTGIKTTSITVNTIHVKLDGTLLGLTGDIIVSSAHCDASFSATKTSRPRMNGLGTVGSGANTANLDFTAAKSGSKPSGNIFFQDSAQNVLLKSKSLKTFSVDTTTQCATFSGSGSVNGKSSYTYTIQACDNSGALLGNDTFSITINGPAGFAYTRSGALTSGNLQLHV